MRLVVRVLVLSIFFLSLIKVTHAINISDDTIKTPHYTQIIISSPQGFIDSLKSGIEGGNLASIKPYLSDSVIVIFTINEQLNMTKATPDQTIAGIHYLLNQLPASKVELYESRKPYLIVTLKFTSSKLLDAVRVIFYLDNGKVDKVILE